MSLSCLTPIFLHGRQLPCGKCAVCVRKRIENWSFRFDAESKNWLNASFITLTYDDAYLPKNGVDIKEVQRFFKRLRSFFDFKYFCISEYGPTTLRPHYHFIIWSNLSPSQLYDMIERNWHSLISLGEITEGRCRYVANYHVSKTFKPAGKNDNFCIMSKGIGLSYLTESRLDYFRKSGNMFVNHYDGYRQSLPRYYKKKILFSIEQMQRAYQLAEKNGDISSISAAELARYQRWEKRYLEKKLKKNKKI